MAVAPQEAKRRIAVVPQARNLDRDLTLGTQVQPRFAGLLFAVL